MVLFATNWCAFGGKIKWLKAQTVVKLRNRPVKFWCLITSGELLREGLKNKKKMRGLEGEKVGAE